MTTRILFIFLFLFFAFPISTSASVVINEVLPNPTGDESGEFIELYNTGTEEVVLDGYSLSDKGGKTFEILTLTLASGAYKVYFQTESGIQINNSDEEVIYLRNAESGDVDTFTFTDSEEGRSWSRVPNGSGGPTNDTDPTPNSQNSAPPTATPKPTDEPSPEQEDEAEEASEPTNTPSPKPTSPPKPTKPKATPTKLPTRVPTKSKFTIDLSEASEGDDVDVDELRKKMEEGVLGSSTEDGGGFPVAAFLLIGSGICFASASGYLIQKKRREVKSGKIGGDKKTE